MNLNGENERQVINVLDPISFIVKDGFIYFTNDTAMGPKDGIYKVNMDVSDIQILYDNANSDGFEIEMHIVGDYLYYYSKSGLLGDQKFHRLNLDTLFSEVIE